MPLCILEPSDPSGYATSIGHRCNARIGHFWRNVRQLKDGRSGEIVQAGPSDEDQSGMCQGGGRLVDEQCFRHALFDLKNDFRLGCKIYIFHSGGHSS